MGKLIFRGSKSYLLLMLVGLLTLAGGCNLIYSESFRSFWQTGQISFKPSRFNQSFNLNRLPPGTVLAILPVRSIMSGMLAEEQVTKFFNQSLKDYFGNRLIVITDDAASITFSELDLWENYFDYLTKYQPSSVTDFKHLRYLYQRQLNAQYIISIASDYTIPAMTFPQTLMIFLHVEIWDLTSEQKVWEGGVEGGDVVDKEIWLNNVIKETVERACRRMVREMGKPLNEAAEYSFRW